MLYWLTQWFRDVQLGARRSSGWSRVRKEHLKKQGECQACGRTYNLSVHHKIPFYLAPELEETPSNLITLCEGPVINCHYVFGHCYAGWKSYNPNVERDVCFVKTLREQSEE